MSMLNCPPTRASSCARVEPGPDGIIHWVTWSPCVQASYTSAGVAAILRDRRSSFAMTGSFVGGEEFFQRVQARFPERAVTLEPVGDLAQGFGIEADMVLAPFDAAVDQAGILQHLEVLGHRVERHVVGV